MKFPVYIRWVFHNRMESRSISCVNIYNQSINQSASTIEYTISILLSFNFKCKIYIYN